MTKEYSVLNDTFMSALARLRGHCRREGRKTKPWELEVGEESCERWFSRFMTAVCPDLLQQCLPAQDLNGVPRASFISALGGRTNWTFGVGKEDMKTGGNVLEDYPGGAGGRR